MKEIFEIINFIRKGLNNLQDVAVELNREKDLYASKALSLAKGFASSVDHTMEIVTIQPTFSYVDVISDICFKFGANIDGVVAAIYDEHKEKSNNLLKSYIKGDDSLHKRELKRICREKSTGDCLGYIENVYNKHLLNMLSADVRKAIEAAQNPNAFNAQDQLIKRPEVHYYGPVSSESRSIEDENDEIIKHSLTRREKNARIIEQFVYARWAYKKRLKKKRVLIVYAFLSRVVAKYRLCALIRKRKMETRCRILIQRYVCKYMRRYKQKKHAMKIICFNLRRLYRNYVFRNISMACLCGARRLLQREWSKRHANLELRLLRIEAYLVDLIALNSKNEAGKKISVSQSKYAFERKWLDFSKFTREEILKFNVNILELINIEENQQDLTPKLLSRRLESNEKFCAIHDVEMQSKQRQNAKLSQKYKSPGGNDDQARPSKSDKLRRGTAPNVNPTRKRNDSIRLSERPRRASKKQEKGAPFSDKHSNNDADECVESDTDVTKEKDEYSALHSDLDRIKKMLSI